MFMVAVGSTPFQAVSAAASGRSARVPEDPPMPIDPSNVGTTTEPRTVSWTSKDSLLYALGIGAGTDDLAFTTENSIGVDQRAYPTQAVILGGLDPAILGMVGDYDRRMIVHGEQLVELHATLPVEGTIEVSTEVTGLYDKGKGAVIEVTSRSVDAETGTPLFSLVTSLFVRGEGGFGGESGPDKSANDAPDTAPDHALSVATGKDQALVYRLSGDRNPLHSDPTFAQKVGFDQPILHGLATFGIAGRALLDALVDSDPGRLRSIEGRFTKPVLPGETLTVKVWTTEPGVALFEVEGEDGRSVLSAGRVTFV